VICRQCHLKPATKRGTFCSRPCQWLHVQAIQLSRRAGLSERMKEIRAKQTPEQRSAMASRARRMGAYQYRMRILGEAVWRLPQRLTREDLLEFGMTCYKRGKNAERMRHAQKRVA
jgi:hypothetical protein